MTRSRLSGHKRPGMLAAMALAIAGMMGSGFTGTVNAQDVSQAGPVTATEIAHKHLLLDTAKIGDRFVAVGSFGHIVLSDDGGETWRQTTDVPAAVTLTSLSFATDQIGWAVGHDATILKTEDAGESWTRQFDDPYHEAPLLDVLAMSTEKVLAVGAYGKMVISMDGGATWEDRLLFEEDDFHVNALIQAKDGTVWAASEAGSLYKSLDGGLTYEPADSPYEGSYWNGLALESGRVLIFGMRGNIFYSDDGESWTKSQADTTQSLSGGAVLGDGTIKLVGNGGIMLTSSDQGETFSQLYQPDRVDMTAVAEKPDGTVYMTGAKGIKVPHPEATLQ